MFGEPVFDYQLSKAKLARMAALIQAGRQFSYDVARKMAAGEGTLEASMVKAYVCRAAEWVTREAMQLHGGMGYAEEFPVSRYLRRRARALDLRRRRRDALPARDRPAPRRTRPFWKKLTRRGRLIRVTVGEQPERPTTRPLGRGVTPCRISDGHAAISCAEPWPPSSPGAVIIALGSGAGAAPVPFPAGTTTFRFTSAITITGSSPITLTGQMAGTSDGKGNITFPASGVKINPASLVAWARPSPSRPWRTVTTTATIDTTTGLVNVPNGSMHPDAQSVGTAGQRHCVLLGPVAEKFQQCEQRWEEVHAFGHDRRPRRSLVLSRYRRSPRTRESSRRFDR